MAQVRAHIAALNAHFDQHSDTACFRRFRLEEDTVQFKIAMGAATGEVSVSLFERSSYPNTGGLAFAEGSDELMVAVESISSALSEGAALDRCLRQLAGAVPTPPSTVALQLADLPTSSGASASSNGGHATTETSATSDDGASEDDAADDDDDDDDDEHTNLDYVRAPLPPPDCLRGGCELAAESALPRTPLVPCPTHAGF